VTPADVAVRVLALAAFLAALAWALDLFPWQRKER
jgi:hypothetical protein